MVVLPIDHFLFANSTKETPGEDGPLDGPFQFLREERSNKLSNRDSIEERIFGRKLSPNEVVKPFVRDGPQDPMAETWKQVTFQETVDSVTVRLRGILP